MAPTQDEHPEFTTSSYFMMIFAAGIGSGLFIYGSVEPLTYNSGVNFFAKQDARTQDEVARMSLNLTISNWGLSAWAAYLIVAVAQGMASRCFRLLKTFRSCFYPILGDCTWGWIGDVIDGLTIVTTVVGIVTSLGVGAGSIAVGFQKLEFIPDDPSDELMTTVKIMTIWGVTAIVTTSVMAGLLAGVQLLSQIASVGGLVMLFLIMVMVSFFAHIPI